MSSMTSGVKMLDLPSTLRSTGAFSPRVAREPSFLENELALGWLERVVVVELLAADELLQRRWRAQPVDAELALDELGVGVVPLALDAVDAERLARAADVEGPVIHRVAQARARVAADDLAAALHHEPGHRTGAAERDDRAALLVDPGASANLALDHQVAAADRRARQGPGVGVDDDDPGHHVLAGRPADAPGDVDLGAVDHAQREIAQGAFEVQLAAGQDARAQRVLGSRVEHRDVGDALLVEQPPQLEVDPPGGEMARVEGGRLPVDLRYLRDTSVKLDQAAGVEQRLLDGWRLIHRVHTITVLS